MKTDEKFEEYIAELKGNPQIDMEITMATKWLKKAWNHQQKKINELEKENTFLRKSLKQCSEVFLDIGRYGLTNWDSKDCRKLGNELKEIKLGE